ncbi:tetratricopeptide repeat protein [Methanobrevibacter sp.]|uniref:tetratricopeptide repeat protein n=1 Tax=Methanobrevibacter sp. TaxID=66852 RepID=UPI00386E3D21
MSKEWEDIKVNRRKGDKAVFESPLVQSIYDRIGYLREETTDILREMDSTEFKQRIDEFDIEEFGENAIEQFSDIAYDLSSFKDEVISREDVPDILKKTSKDAKVALNRDEMYLRQAKRKLDRFDEGLATNGYDLNTRVIGLCDKSIYLNSENHEAYYLKGLALINLKNYDEAIEELINCLALNEEYIDARLAIAKANRLNKDYEDAISVYDSVLRMDDDSFEAFKGKAYTYYDWEKYGEASNFFKKANSIEFLDEESQKMWDECLGFD